MKRCSASLLLRMFLKKLWEKFATSSTSRRGPIFEQTEHSIVVDASLPIRELRAETGWNFEFQPRETVEAWVKRLAGRLLQRDESLRIGEFEITALQTHASGLRRARITLLATDAVEAKEPVRE